MQAGQVTLSAGDKMPFCAGMRADQQFYAFDAQAGRPAVLVLGADVSLAALEPLVDALATHRTALAAQQADLLVMLGSATGFQAWQSGFAGLDPAVLVTCQEDFFARCGASAERPMVVVIDRAARVIACWPFSLDPACIAAAALQAVQRMHREPPGLCLLPAPVLALTGLLDPQFCRELIERFEAGASFDSGLASLDANGQPQHRIDYAKKCRRDWLLEPGDGVYDRVLATLDRRCVPEMKRVFQHDVTHTDRILVARYDAGAGHFRRHRDNVGESVAFRQFALSVNLNAEEYEGGNLLFPEYNDHQYRPGTGDGIVFSSSLLHEVTPMTRGRRYVLLTFLHDIHAEARRVASQEARSQAAAARADVPQPAPCSHSLSTA